MARSEFERFGIDGITPPMPRRSESDMTLGRALLITAGLLGGILMVTQLLLMSRGGV